MSTEVFTNLASGTVTSGGTTTSDTAFTVTPTNPFPAASSSAKPPTFFRFTDAANDSEIMWATTAPGGGSSGQSWTVLRGQEGTTAISHSANWNAVGVISAGTLEGFKQATAATTSAVTVGNTTTETLIASYQPVTGEIVAGTTLEAVAFGSMTKTGTANITLSWYLRWGSFPGTQICVCTTGSYGSSLITTLAAGSSIDVNATAQFISTTSVVGNINFWWSGASSTNQGNAVASNGTGITISGTGPLTLSAAWGTASASYTITVPAPLIYRAA